MVPWWGWVIIVAVLAALVPIKLKVFKKILAGKVFGLPPRPFPSLVRLED